MFRLGQIVHWWEKSGVGGHYKSTMTVYGPGSYYTKYEVKHNSGTVISVGLFRLTIKTEDGIIVKHKRHIYTSLYDLDRAMDKFC